MTQQISQLLELREKIKSKKPDFIRQDYQRRKRLRKLKWRKPKGIHSKIRHHFKGRHKMPSPGFKLPKTIYGLHQSGLKIIRVATIGELQNLNKNTEGAIISGNLGSKKRLELLKKAKELAINVLNLKIDDEIKRIEENISKKKKVSDVKAEEHKEVKETEPKEKKIAQLTDEQKKEAEKLEKDKLLTKRI